MALPAGVVVGQTVGVADEFSPLLGHTQWTFPAGMASAGSRGSAVKPTATAGQVDLATAGDTVLAGVLGQTTYDPTAIPSSVSERIFAAGILTDSPLSQPVSVWKNGIFRVTQVSGTVAFGDFLEPDTGGKWKSSTTINTIKNGAVVCLVGNTNAGDPITISVNLA